MASDIVNNCEHFDHAGQIERLTRERDEARATLELANTQRDAAMEERDTLREALAGARADRDRWRRNAAQVAEDAVAVMRERDEARAEAAEWKQESEWIWEGIRCHCGKDRVCDVERYVENRANGREGDDDGDA